MEHLSVNLFRWWVTSRAHLVIYFIFKCLMNLLTLATY